MTTPATPGRSNPPVELVELAGAVATVLLDELPTHSRSLQECLYQRVDAQTSALIEVELAILYVHLFDRLIFARLGPEKRNVFVDALMVEVGEGLRRRHGHSSPFRFISSRSEREAIADEFRASLSQLGNSRQSIYSGFQELEPLLWGYVRLMVETYPGKLSGNPAGMTGAVAGLMGAYKWFVETLKDLDAAGLLRH